MNLTNVLYSLLLRFTNFQKVTLLIKKIRLRDQIIVKVCVITFLYYKISSWKFGKYNRKR